MGEAVTRLTGLVAAANRYDLPHEDVREVQVAAMNERFQHRRDRIKLLGHRVREGGVTEIRSRAEAVPLLFPHTAYKSYPENFLIDERWERLGKWLDTVAKRGRARDKMLPWQGRTIAWPRSMPR